jgi:hypothetical protein
MSAERTLRCDLKTEVDFSCRTERTLECDLKTEVDFSCCTERTLECDLKTKVDFRLPSETDFRCDYSSRFCTTPGGLKMQKTKTTFQKAKANEKSEKTNSFVAGAGLKLRSKSPCATGVGLGATISVDLCHRSGLEYLSHGFQTKVRLLPEWA